MQPRHKHLISIFVFTSVFSWGAYAQVQKAVLDLQNRWAEVNYTLEGEQQLSALDDLALLADQVTSQFPSSAEAWTWSGIIKSTFAGARGGLGALSLAKKARRDLEKAIALDPEAMSGSAFTSLGTLYYSVPGWPVGFGDNDKAEELLTKALSIAPDDIDANFFFAEYKRDSKQFDAARSFYLKAQQAPARPGRELADSGRQEDIRKALEALDSR